MLVRGTLRPWFIQPDGDATWTEIDWARAATLEARWVALGVAEEERRKLLPCAIWLKKFPGLRFEDPIMTRIDALACKN